MELKNYISDKSRQINEFFSSSKGRDILLYLVFVVVAFVFWAILALDKPVQENYKVNFNIVGIPKNVTIISDYPNQINVTVRNNGYTLMRYIFGDVPDINVNFNDFSNGKGLIKIPKQEIEDLLVSKFGTGTTIMSMAPESYTIKYTSLAGKTVPVEVVGNYTANFQYVVNGAVQAMPDSVIVYADAAHLNSIERIFTEKVIDQNLTDSLYTRIAVQRIKDVKIVPDSVDIMIPVEPLVTKHSTIPIKVENEPDNEKLITFPSVAEVSYLVPISMYDKNSEHPFEATVDYNDTKKKSDKIPLKIGTSPKEYKNIQLKEDSVEYIIEH